MWPNSSEEWYKNWEAEAVLHVKGRLLRFPILRVFAENLAWNAVAPAHEVANYLRQYPGYFESSKHYGRWLRFLSYREALRLILQTESVETILQTMRTDVRWHLRLRYIDQLNDDETAGVLDLRANGQVLFDVLAASDHSLAAYHELHRALERRTPAAGKVQFPDLFPLFPNTCRNSRSHDTPGGQL